MCFSYLQLFGGGIVTDATLTTLCANNCVRMLSNDLRDACGISLLNLCKSLLEMDALSNAKFLHGSSSIGHAQMILNTNFLLFI